MLQSLIKKILLLAIPVKFQAPICVFDLHALMLGEFRTQAVNELAFSDNALAFSKLKPNMDMGMILSMAINSGCDIRIFTELSENHRDIIAYWISQNFGIKQKDVSKMLLVKQEPSLDSKEAAMHLWLKTLSYKDVRSLIGVYVTDKDCADIFGNYNITSFLVR